VGDYWKSWSSTSALEFYKKHRGKRSDVYKSEKHFLQKILGPGTSILDVGCAAGGFYNVLRSYQPNISYTGVDISGEMIAEARKLHPDLHFEVGGGDDLPFQDNSFDMVMCLGTLHMVLNWREIIEERWRVAKGYLLFDLRLVEKGPTIEDIVKSYMKIAFDGKWDGRSKVPYVTLNVKDAFSAINRLRPKPSKVESYGYFHPVSHMATTPYKEVCMAMFLLGKSKNMGRQKIEWNVPLALPK